MVSLVVPGSSERMLAKARTIDADEIIIDLEDAVIPERKPQALQMVLTALETGPFSARNVAVRVNAVGSPWAHRELIALAGAPLHSVIVPKVEDPGDLAFVDRLLTGAEAAADAAADAAARAGTEAAADAAARAGAEAAADAAARAGAEATAHPDQTLKLQALIETARGVAQLQNIVTATDRLHSVILGYADLSVSLGRSPAGRDDLDRWLAIQDAVLLAARTANLRAVDGPHLVIDDTDGLTRAARRAADLGFDGKWAIHPSQLEPIKHAFAPSQADVEHARAVLTALEQAAHRGGGAVALDGEMLDEPVRLAALRTLERAGQT